MFSGGIKWEHWLEMGWNVEKILEINNGGNHFSKVPVYSAYNFNNIDFFIEIF